MKRLFKIFLAALPIAVSPELGLGVAVAAPRFVTPNMTLRNGLTDEQYELLWKQGKHPKIDIATARDWVFRSSRFANVTNWLEIIGKTNDFARLVYPTMTSNEVLVASNSFLVVENSKLEKDLERAEAEADAAKHDADVYKALQKAAKRAEKNLSKVIKELEKARDKSSTEEEQSLYIMLINLLKGNEPN